jgi:riboflavin kinase/FMN adenylyltransferase
MQTVNDLAELQRGTPTLLTIGAFDGVHRGHQYLIREIVDRARHMGFDSMVITFDPRPQVVLRPGSLQLTDGAEKERIISAIGPNVLVILPFTRELAQVPAGDFIRTLLDHVNVAEVWIGADFAFGHNREGNVDFLIGAGQHSGFGVHVVARQQFLGESISSTRIRELVRQGDVRRAAILLGHYVSLSGTVVSGSGRGAGLGFPTANVQPPPDQLLPGTGIYAAYLRNGSQGFPAAVSVGYNVTFGGQDIVVEAHVLDFVGDLRQERVGLDFVARVRDEQRFDSVEDLVAEMHRDVHQVREILETAEEPGELLLSP